MSQRARKKRKRRRRSAGPAAKARAAGASAAGDGRSGASAEPAAADRRSRSQIKDDEARATLVPLREGERPAAVTVAALIAFGLAAANLIAYVAGLEIRGDRPAFLGIAAFTTLMLAMTWGLWRARYWAVLGMEAMLGLIVVFFSLALMTAENVTTVLIILAVVVPAGTLFWFLVKAMARIQMPERS